jgi:hypothetical protein
VILAFRLAGFFAAHAIWCVSDGETLTPMLARVGEDGTRSMDRLVMDDLAAAVASGRRSLDSNDADASDAALVYDGRIPLGTDKIDAIIIEIRAYFSPQSEAVIAIPYTPKSSGRFRVHKPKLLQRKNCDHFDMKAVLGSFFEGVGEHEKGSNLWNASLDESK